MSCVITVSIIPICSIRLIRPWNIYGSAFPPSISATTRAVLSRSGDPFVKPSGTVLSIQTHRNTSLSYRKRKPVPESSSVNGEGTSLLKRHFKGAKVPLRYRFKIEVQRCCRLISTSCGICSIATRHSTLPLAKSWDILTWNSCVCRSNNYISLE